MRIFHNNLIDADGVVITATSEVSTLPVENVAHEHRALPWRTGTSVALEAVVFDLGTAQAVTSVIVLDHTLTAGDSLIKIQGHTSDSWGAPDVNETLTYSAGAISKVFSSASKRYWRLTFTKSAAGESRDIGRIFLGPYYQTEDEPDYDGYAMEYADESVIQSTAGGQEFTDVRGQRENPRTDFSKISNTMMESLKTYIRAVGRNGAHFIQVGTASPFDAVQYVKLAKAIKTPVSAQDVAPLWDVNLEYREQL